MSEVDVHGAEPLAYRPVPARRWERKRRYGPGEMCWSRKDEVGGVPMGRKKAAWTRGWLRAVAEGRTGKDALVAGAMYGGIGGTNLYKDETLAKKMELHLRNPDVKMAVRQVYTEAGFSLEDAIEMHRRHIIGFTGDDGEYVPPNYNALKDYLKAAMPQEPTRIQMQKQIIPPPRVVREEGAPPRMVARAIGDE